MDSYAVLNIKPDAASNEIRAAYRLALLRNHPDTCKGEANFTIDQINAAYNQLTHGDPVAGHNEMIEFTDILDLNEFQFSEQLNSFEKQCRCGQNIVVTIDELESNGDADEIAVQCSGCSLWVLIQYEVEGAN